MLTTPEPIKQAEYKAPVEGFFVEIWWTPAEGMLFQSILVASVAPVQNFMQRVALAHVLTRLKLFRCIL